jgi:branched-chain amino acid transport system permease protein
VSAQITGAILDGILGGSVYALMAAGLTLIFGVLDIINIAQGILVVLGAYLSYVLSVHLGIDLFAGLAITVPAMFVIGVGIYWLFIRPLRGYERTAMSLLVTYAVAIIIEGILYQVFGVNFVELQAWYVTATVRVGSYYLPVIYLFAFAMAAVVLAALWVVLYRTRFGRSVRATMQNRTAARLVGIDTDRVAAVCFGIGVAVTAFGAMIFGATNSFNANSGYDLISRLLSIVILGGLGSVTGALGAAMFMTTVEALVAIWNPNWATVVYYAALVIVLTWRPTGLLGQRTARAQ